MRRLAIAPILAVLALAGCGGGVTTAGSQDASLMLDFTPNAVHAGIYMTLARDYDGAQGVHLRVRRPSESTDSVRLLETGRVQFAILDISDLALAREKGADLRGVMAIVQRPLAAVFAKPSIKRPRDLEGHRAGVSGLPSDVAVLNSVVRGDGGRPAKVKRTTIGFTAVPALVGGKVDAVTAFWNVEGLELKKQLKGVREFDVDDFDAPAYPELVLCATDQTIQDEPALVQNTVKALVRGYTEVQADPESAAETMVQRVKGLKRAALEDQLNAVSPAFTGDAPRYGVLDPQRLEAWATWAKRFGLVKKKPDVASTFATQFTR